MKIGNYLLLAVLISALLGCVSSTEIKRTAADPQEAFSRHIKLAMQYIGSKNRDLARVHLQKAAKFESRDRRAQLHNGYGLLYQMEQETALAEKHFRKALASDKTDSSARYNFAAFLYNQRRFKEARQQMKLVSADLGYERRPQALYILGLAQRQTGQQYSLLAQPTAKSLWLAVRIEDSFGNRDAAASQGLKLKNLFPYSSENLEYQKWLKQ